MSRNDVCSGEQIEEVSFASSLHVVLVTSSWFNIHFFISGTRSSEQECSS